jgi:N-acetylglucosamine-6-phosphate deacetylase
MIVLAGGDLVLPDRVVTGGAVVIDGAIVAAVEGRPGVDPAGARIVDASQCYLVPGFVDVHVHGIAGVDAFDPGGIAAMAAALPAYGVTAFCPTTVACDPDARGSRSRWRGG